ncbi:LppU/SCO3897 family protein [Streptomyces sp. 1331.2]|uniref:LppU/SCO3897 family protein n=1 Tax=Streptomyces sp. 1331.2 TaxID=1938835 RepID=UPI000BC7B52E|nr:hypothetical protein [Streptomyces sp. 1331.2]SOB82941.1 hypothetical protein SAMN06272789_3130 [Streptomyces sp. 1331.2]
MPYGPPPGDGNPYSSGGAYGAPPPPPGQPGPPPPGYGYPSPPPPPEQAYGYQQAAPGYGYGYPPPGPTDGVTCRFCGGYPAVQTTVRGHQGLLVAYRMLRMSGPFCRTCGTATVRDMSARTLVQGWWSLVSWLLTPITLLLNLIPHNKFKQLPPPVPGTHGPQLDPGVPLTRRPHIAMLVVPASLAVTVVLAATGVLGPTKTDNPSDPIIAAPSPAASTFTFTPPPAFPSPTFTLPVVPSITLPPVTTPSDPADGVDSAKAGDCLRNENGTTGATTDTHPKVSVLACTDPKAQYKVVYKYPATSDEKVCEQQPKADSWYTRTYTNLPALNYVLCLKKLK